MGQCMNDQNNNQYVRKTVKGLFADLAEMSTAALRGYDQACAYHYKCFGIEHLIYEMVSLELFSGRVKRAGGSPILLQRELVKSFRSHRASSGACAGYTSIHPDIREIADAFLEERENNPERSKEEQLNFLIDAILLKVDGSATAEMALVECGARRLFVEPESYASSIDDDINDIFGGHDILEVHSIIDIEMGDISDAPSSYDSNTPFETPDFSESSLGNSLRDRASKAGATQKGEANVTRKPADPKKPTTSGTTGQNAKDPLAGLLRNLTEEAKSGQIDKVVGREQEIDHVIACLKRRRKGSVLLYGEPGIGKTAIAEGVALRLSRGGEGTLDGRPVYELSVGSMVAGTRYRGDFEERATALLSKMKEENAILFIDEIHMLVGAGGSAESNMGAANLFKPALARGDLTIIGATTSVEVRAIRKDGAMMRRFEPIMVREPTKEETLQILKGSVDAYLDHHRLTMGDGVLEAICHITGQYQPERRFPDKAFDLLDSACVVASEMLDMTVEGEDFPKLLPAHVETAADRAKIRRPHMPQHDLLERVRLLNLVLSDRVHGQSVAIKNFCSRVNEAVFDLRQHGMRFACVLAGPDVTAKNELAKTFAQHMRMPVTVIQGQHLSGPDAVQMLLGTGVSGDHGGILTEASDKDPEMVFLVSNVSSMSPQALRVIEEVLRTGVIRNAEGRNISFRTSWMLILASYDPDQKISGFGFGMSNINVGLTYLEKEVPKFILDQLDSPIFMERVTSCALRELVLQTVEDVEDTLRPMGLRLKITDDLVDKIMGADLSEKGLPEVTRATIMPMIARSLVEDASRTKLVLDIDRGLVEG